MVYTNEANDELERIRYALKRSRVRFSVLNAIAERGETYCGEICRTTGYSARDVAGVIRGNGDYTPRHSFVELGLVVEFKDRRDRRLIRYALSDYGVFVYNKIKNDFLDADTAPDSQKPFFKRY